MSRSQCADKWQRRALRTYSALPDIEQHPACTSQQMKVHLRNGACVIMHQQIGMHASSAVTFSVGDILLCTVIILFMQSGQ